MSPPPPYLAYFSVYRQDSTVQASGSSKCSNLKVCNTLFSHTLEVLRDGIVEVTGIPFSLD